MRAIVCAGLIFAACGGGAPARPPSSPSNDSIVDAPVEACDGDRIPRDEAHAEAFYECVLAQFDAIRQRVCACADRACADQAKADIETWMAGVDRGLTGRPGSPSKAQDQRFDELDDAFDACHDRLVPPPP